MQGATRAWRHGRFDCVTTGGTARPAAKTLQTPPGISRAGDCATLVDDPQPARAGSRLPPPPWGGRIPSRGDGLKDERNTDCRIHQASHAKPRGCDGQWVGLGLTTLAAPLGPQEVATAKSILQKHHRLAGMTACAAAHLTVATAAAHTSRPRAGQHRRGEPPCLWWMRLTRPGPDGCHDPKPEPALSPIRDFVRPPDNLVAIERPEGRSSQQHARNE